MPTIQKFVNDFYKRICICDSIDPNEVIAYGTAFTGIIYSDDPEYMHVMIEMDYNNHQRSFSIELDDGTNYRTILADSCNSKKKTFYTTYDSQEFF